MMGGLALGLSFLVACGGEAPEETQEALDIALRDWTPVTERWPVTQAVRAVAVFEGGVYVGGEGLLGLVGPNGIEVLTETNVTDLIPVAGRGVLVLDAEGALHLWDGSLAASGIHTALEGPVHALTLRRDEVWLAADERVYRWVDGNLEHLELNARRLQGHSGGDGVVADGGWVTPTEGGFMVEELPGEAWLGIHADRLLALEAGVVYERRDGDWTPWSVEGVRGGVVSAAGAAYLVADQGVMRVEGTDAFRLDDPGAPLMAAGDALWWVADGHLHRAGDAALPLGAGGEGEGQRLGDVGYAADVAPFSAANCERCHAPLRTARDLTTEEAWVANIDGAIDQLERGLMPLDGSALQGGDVALLRQWRDGGLLP